MKDDKAALAAFREAGRRYGTRGGVPLNPGAARCARRIAFAAGAAWQRKQPIEITDEMVDIIQEAVYDDIREGDRAVTRAALEAALNGGKSW